MKVVPASTLSERDWNRLRKIVLQALAGDPSALTTKAHAGRLFDACRKEFEGKEEHSESGAG